MSLQILRWVAAERSRTSPLQRTSGKKFSPRSMPSSVALGPKHFPLRFPSLPLQPSLFLYADFHQPHVVVLPPDTSSSSLFRSIHRFISISLSFFRFLCLSRPLSWPRFRECCLLARRARKGAQQQAGARAHEQHVFLRKPGRGQRVCRIE